MIHFDFIVDDIDAENIMCAMGNDSNMCHTAISDRMVELARSARVEGKPVEDIIFDDDPYIKWYNSRIEYIEELTLKMKNTRVKE